MSSRLDVHLHELWHETLKIRILVTGRSVFSGLYQATVQAGSREAHPISLLTLSLLTLLGSNVPGNPLMGMGIPPFKIKIMLESNPPKSMMLVGRLGALCRSQSDLGWQTVGQRDAYYVLYAVCYML